MNRLRDWNLNLNQYPIIPQEKTLLKNKSFKNPPNFHFQRPAVASETRSLDSIGGGNILRNLDSIGGGHVLRQLDSIGGGHVLRNVPEYLVPRHPYYEKRGYDPLR